MNQRKSGMEFRTSGTAGKRAPKICGKGGRFAFVNEELVLNPAGAAKKHRKNHLPP
jgi:hypothetical protein